MPTNTALSILTFNNNPDLDANANANANQGETRCRKRIKTLEFVVAGLREKLEDTALAEKRAAGTVERAEARATSAEGSKQDLRASVEAIKVDFEVRLLALLFLLNN